MQANSVTFSCPVETRHWDCLRKIEELRCRKRGGEVYSLLSKKAYLVQVSGTCWEVSF